MASSQVEIVSSSPFGCVVLRDRNICSRDSNANFHSNLKQFVRGHIHPLIDSDTNSSHIINANKFKINDDVVDENNGELAILLDRWAAKKTRKKVSTIEVRRLEEIDPALNATPRKSSGKTGSNTIRGASSLVQIWEARLTRCNSTNSCNPNSTIVGGSRTSSLMSCTPSIEEEPSGQSVDSCDSANIPIDSDLTESTKQSARQSTDSMISESGEGERLKIADIIRKLSSDVEQGMSTGVIDSSSKERSRHSYISEQAENKGLTQVVSSPRLRGRQAYNDLLVRMEQDRNKELGLLTERHAVSKFSHRGRLQSMLRLRFLQRGTAIKDQQQPKSTRSTSSSDASGLKNSSSIMHLRERFSSGCEPATLASSAAVLSVPKEIVNSNAHEDSSSSSICIELAEDKYKRDTSSSPTRIELAEDKHKRDNSIIVKELHEGMLASAKDKHMQETHIIAKKEHEEEKLEPQMSKVQEDIRKEPSVSSEYTTVDDSVSRTSEIPRNEYEESSITSDARQENGINLDKHEHSESTSFTNEWDENYEEEYDEQGFSSAYDDWFSNIARPRSYWEDRRKAWYEEMLSTCSDNNDIRKLLERRTVSNYLASDFRERMDQLMVAHFQIQVNQDDVESELSNHERLNSLMMYASERESRKALEQEQNQDQEINDGESRRRITEEEKEEEEEEEEEEDEVSPMSRDEYVEVTEYFDQSPASMHSPSTFRSWCYSDYHETSDQSIQAPITPSCRSKPFDRALDQERPRSASSTSQSRIETEIVYELKEQMEELQREIAELRKSMKSCMEMQVNFQNSLLREKQQQPVQKVGNDFIDGRPNKRNCCICKEKQVDSFLYRCGHMCTCFKCAYELQYCSGKCPMCRAPILDVVRAHMD